MRQSVHPSVRSEPKSCAKHVSYSILFKIEMPNFVLIQFWVAGYCILFLGYCDLDLWPQVWKNRARSISPILF